MTIQPDFSAFDRLNKHPATAPSPRRTNSIVPTTSAVKGFMCLLQDELLRTAYYCDERRVKAQRNLSRRSLSRSEEHTSELQSRLHLVCRLLLEKKKTIQKQ